MSSVGSTLRIICDITKCVVEVNQNKRSCDEDIDAIFNLFSKLKNKPPNQKQLNNSLKKEKHIKCETIECKSLKCDSIKINNNHT